MLGLTGATAYLPAGNKLLPTVKSKGMVACCRFCAKAAMGTTRLAAVKSAVANMRFISLSPFSSGALVGSPSLINAEMVDDFRQP
jgi:hypothetical protein